ncbi:GrpB family protein [Kitasatospora sp. NPDC096077]|uniref:GrpB family protein n=1 Tax=Kitasatospora sp. NPDC096077 TaxID=3155544 RepID=UPI0033178944
MAADTQHIVVVAHDPAWQAGGLALAAELRSELAPLPVHIEHIGSTAIPGMAAKPVFDLQITVTDLAEAERAFDQPLAAMGFRRSPYQHDHVPAGLDDDPERWTKRLWSRRSHAGADCNLHVRLLGSPNERLALLFRDWFRAHPEAVPAYAQFKTLLAGAVGDIGVYADIKDPVVDLVITVANSWAAETGWAPHGTTS